MSWNTIEIEITSGDNPQVLLWRLLSLMSWLATWIPGWQATQRPCLRPLPLVRSGVWPCKT